MFKTAGAGEAPGMRGYIPSRRDDNGQVAECPAKCKSLRLFESEAVKLEQIGSMPLNC
jgi:hypothetical protein